MPPIPGDVQAAFWVLVAACLTTLTIYVRSLGVAQNTHSEQLSSIRSSLSQLVAGSGNRNVMLQGPTSYDQLNDPNPDGSLPMGRANECGEECCADVIKWVHGVPMEADYLRFLLGGARRQPLTSGSDLVAILARCNVKSAVINPSTSDLPATVQRITKAGGWVVALGGWVDPVITHWVVAYASSANGWSVLDPWGGRRYNRDWPTVQGLYDGECVEIQSRPDSSPASNRIG